MSKRKRANDQWDDSALIDSWDAAVEEYKQYHSLHARGENIETVLEEAKAREDEPAEEEAALGQWTTMDDGTGADVDGYDEGEIDEGDDVDDNDEEAGAARTTADGLTTNGASVTAQPVSGVGLDVPQSLSAGGQDEALKNLMMSWYYAGYYS